MKLKDYIIIGLALVVIGLIVFRNDGDDNSFENERKILDKKIEDIKTQRDIKKNEADSLKIELDKNKVKIDSLHTYSDSLDTVLKDIMERSSGSMGEIDSLNRELEILKKNPPNREGQDLINSLNKKLN